MENPRQLDEFLHDFLVCEKSLVKLTRNSYLAVFFFCGPQKGEWVFLVGTI